MKLLGQKILGLRWNEFYVSCDSCCITRCNFANFNELLLVQDDDSDMECELEASPAVGVDVVTEAVAHVKVSEKEFTQKFS